MKKETANKMGLYQGGIDEAKPKGRRLPIRREKVI